MAEVWRPKSAEIHRVWLDTILFEASDKLTDWESSFIASIERRLDLKYTLTQDQEAKLEQIYASKTA